MLNYKDLTQLELLNVINEANKELIERNSNKSLSSKPPRQIVVENAKQSIESLKSGRDCYTYDTGTGKSFSKKLVKAVFYENREKRTVAVVLKGYNTGHVYKRAVAKADPKDVYNVHIGKAIALHRALGLPVPNEFANAPQPNEKLVGQVISYIDREAVIRKRGERFNTDVHCMPGSIFAEYGKIVDDSEAVYE